jgi:hypothetical protein
MKKDLLNIYFRYKKIKRLLLTDYKLFFNVVIYLLLIRIKMYRK